MAAACSQIGKGHRGDAAGQRLGHHAEVTGAAAFDAVIHGTWHCSPGQGRRAALAEDWQIQLRCGTGDAEHSRGAAAAAANIADHHIIGGGIGSRGVADHQLGGVTSGDQGAQSVSDLGEAGGPWDVDSVFAPLHRGGLVAGEGGIEFDAATSGNGGRDQCWSDVGLVVVGADGGDAVGQFRHD